MRQRVIDILNQFRGDVDFDKAEGIITNKLINSIDISEFIPALEDEFDIEIGMEYMENENFDTVDAIVSMIEEIQEG